ncbi:MAG: T9SS type A sorting domain-containing protein [Flavobacteriales bacterium]|nr:T9SS type A sorting domain-containing protein [Flavobacteriales bacterium]
MKGLSTAFIGLLFSLRIWSQCAPGQIALTMNITTDSWGYETYWELVSGSNPCGTGTLAWGSNIQTVGCNGGGQQDANGNGYPNNTVIQVPAICLTPGAFYTLYFVDDYGDGGLTFELFENGSLTHNYVGTGIGNSWTFQAGNSGLPPHDSPCNALEVFAGSSTAVDISNIGCGVQSGEIMPPIGNCDASGFWCDNSVNKTVWAKFTVPTTGAYEISTCNNGTGFDTQLAVYTSNNCGSMNTFQLVSANDDAFGGCSAPVCPSNPPSCVDKGSAAYTNVISQIPSCCSSAWDAPCQTLYNQLTNTCTGGNTGCFYTLNGFDSYGDGWNDGFVTITLNGVSTQYTFYTGHSFSWQIPITGNQPISVSWTPGGWPEEVTFNLMDAQGNTILNIPTQPPNGVLFTGVTACQGSGGSHPNASTCYINCLPAGTVCYIQLDGKNGQTGNAVLSVRPVPVGNTVTAAITEPDCPGSFGVLSEGSITPNILGWGINYNSSWTGPDGFTSTDLYLPHINPGTYTLTANDNCGNQITESFVINGPDPFYFANQTTNTCAGDSTGAIAVTVSGGTAPFVIDWQYPNGNTASGAQINSLPSGVYYMYLTDANNCNIIQAVEVKESVFPTVNLGEDLTLCENENVVLTGPNAESYLWSLGFNSVSVFVSAENLGTGEHDIWLTATNEPGCSASDTLHITVETCENTDITEENLFSTQVYPNPTTDFLFISGLTSSDITLTLRNAEGKIMLTDYIKNNSNPNHPIDCSSLAAGIYFLEVQVQNELTRYHKICIAR